MKTALCCNLTRQTFCQIKKKTDKRATYFKHFGQYKIDQTLLADSLVISIRTSPTRGFGSNAAKYAFN